MQWHWQGHPSHETLGEVAQVSHLTADDVLLITSTYDGLTNEITLNVYYIWIFIYLSSCSCRIMKRCQITSRLISRRVNVEIHLKGTLFFLSYCVVELWQSTEAVLSVSCDLAS